MVRRLDLTVNCIQLMASLHHPFSPHHFTQWRESRQLGAGGEVDLQENDAREEPL
jgi:hypothetical protein